MRIASIAVLAASLSAPALAADLFDAPLRGTHYGSEPIAQWGGAYVGGFAGRTMSNYAFDRMAEDLIAHDYRRTYIEIERQISKLPKLPDADGHATAFGAFAGYNYQFDEVVLGFEADFTRGRAAGESSDRIGRSMTTSNGWEHHVLIDAVSRAELSEWGTLRARAGYTMGSFLPYVTGGLALGRADVVTSVDVRDGSHDVAARANWLAGPRTDPFTAYNGYYSYNPVTGDGRMIPNRLENRRRGVMSVGLAGGVGVDVSITRNLFLRAEWQYIHFRDFAGVQASVNNVRAAAGLKF